MTAYRLIEQTLALLSNPDNWTQGRIQEFINGHMRYCIIGALNHFRGNVSLTCPAMMAISDVIKQTYPEYESTFYADANTSMTNKPDVVIAMFNDDRSHKDIVAILEETLSRVMPAPPDWNQLATPKTQKTEEIQHEDANTV